MRLWQECAFKMEIEVFTKECQTKITILKLRRHQKIIK